MHQGSSSVRELVDRLESHLHANEREFARALQISEQSTDDDIDGLLLNETYDRCKVLKQLSVTNLGVSGSDSPSPVSSSNRELQDIYLKQLEGATARIR